MPAQSPTHTAYHVRKYKSGGAEKSFWTKIGSAWAHGDGEGFNIRLAGIVPLNGEIVVRSVKAIPDSDGVIDEGDNSVPSKS